MSLIFFGMPGGMEWILILGVVVLLFGASAIPKLAKSIGKAKTEFEKGVKDGAKDAEEDDEDEEDSKSKKSKKKSESKSK